MTMGMISILLQWSPVVHYPLVVDKPASHRTNHLADRKIRWLPRKTTLGLAMTPHLEYVQQHAHGDLLRVARDS